MASHSPLVSKVQQTLISMARILAKLLSKIYFFNARVWWQGNFLGGTLAKISPKRKMLLRWARGPSIYKLVASQVTLGVPSLRFVKSS